MTRGYIRFTALGDPERNKKFMGGITDENSVMIDKKHLPRSWRSRRLWKITLLKAQ